MSLKDGRTTAARRSWLDWLGDVLLLLGLGFACFFLLTAPDPVPIRLNLAQQPQWGSKWRALLFPALMLLISGILRVAGAGGDINTPVPVTRHEAQKIAAALRVLALFLLLFALVNSLFGSAWPR